MPKTLLWIPSLVALSLVALLFGCRSEVTSTPTPTAQIVEAGWSFGFCLGPCNGTLRVEGQTLSYRVTSRTGDSVFADNHGELTAAGIARLNSFVSAIPEPLNEIYGCPDCADAGAAYLVVRRNGTNRRSTYEYPSPPTELSPIDTFLKDVMDALGDCRSTTDVAITGQCTPVSR